MPTTITPTPAAVTSLTILARRNNSSPPRGWCPFVVCYPSHAAAKRRRMGNNQAMGEDRSPMLDLAKRRLQRAAWIANVAGAFDLFAFTTLLFSVHSDVDRGHAALANTIAFVVLLSGTLLVGDRWGARNSEAARAWLAEGRPPTPAERDHALRLPFLQARVSATLWLAATVIFSALNAIVATQIVWFVPLVMLLGATTTTVVYYLLAERILRPI